MPVGRVSGPDIQRPGQMKTGLRDIFSTIIHNFACFRTLCDQKGVEKMTDRPQRDL